MNRIAAILGWLAVALAGGYWLAYVLIAPVTTADSQIYNVARLFVAERAGLFGNPLWTNVHQIVFPWSFDAVHWPLAKLGRAENLPSFLCLVGLAVIAVLLCREQRTPAAAPVVVLMLLASPLVVFQASTTKNDFATAFFAVASLYFLRRWAAEPGAWRWLAGLGVALGMTAGSKTTGLLLAALLGVAAMAVALRGGWRRVLTGGAVLAAGLVAWGSGEIYLNNRAMFGHLLGPPAFIQAHANPDGLRGGAANLVRHGFNSLSSGLESEAGVRSYRAALTETCAAFLSRVHLDGAGVAPFARDDPRFLLGAHEVASSYGVVAWFALPLALLALGRRRWRDAAWQYAALGVCALVLLSLGTGWQKFGMRLLLPAAVPLLLAGGLMAARWLEERPGWRLGAQAALFALAVAVPLCSWNRGPQAIARAFGDRTAAAMQERLPLLTEWKGVRKLVRHEPVTGRAVVLGINDWALPYLQDSRAGWVIVPNRDHRARLTIEELRGFLPVGAHGRWLVVASQANGRMKLPPSARLVGEYPGAGRAYLIDLAP